MITHGWPGSVFEMLELIPRLTDPAAYGADPNDSFDVVVPSLPGYGFSDAPRTEGMDPASVAALWHEPMTEGLGYERFGAQGGDWGATVATRLAMLRPEAVAGIHLNYLPGSTPRGWRMGPFCPRRSGNFSLARTPGSKPTAPTRTSIGPGR